MFRYDGACDFEEFKRYDNGILYKVRFMGGEAVIWGPVEGGLSGMHKGFIFAMRPSKKGGMSLSWRAWFES